MKKRLLILILCICLLAGCAPTETPPETTQCVTHQDANDDALCDSCGEDLLVTIDFYGVNDLHGKVADADSHPGVDEMSTYFKNARATDEHMALLSVGDMWQGSTESNMTQGQLTTQWMNELVLCSIKGRDLEKRFFESNNDNYFISYGENIFARNLLADYIEAGNLE